MSAIDRVTFRQDRLGRIGESDSLVVFFGNQNSAIEDVKAMFPDFEFIHLMQIHSDVVVNSNRSRELPPKADAHVTSVAKRALCVRSADCLPVLLAVPGGIAAAHAGWRGVENELLIKAASTLDRIGPLESSHAWIGPHIGFSSFEVGRDVGDRLQECWSRVARGSKQNVLAPHAEQEKVYVNLEAIARAQLSSTGVSPLEIESAAIDTLTSMEYASFRRDKTSAGRNLSFIALK